VSDKKLLTSSEEGMTGENTSAKKSYSGNPEFDQMFTSKWSLRRTIGLLQRPDRPIWRGATVLAMRSEVSGVALRPWMPRLLWPKEKANVVLFSAFFQDTSFGIQYRELGLLVETRYFGKPVLHVPWILVDDDSALLQGRELFGFPKKMAQFSETQNNGETTLSVQRRGVEILRLRSSTGAKIDNRGVFTGPMVNVRGLPGLIPPLLIRCNSEEVVQHTHQARLNIHVQASDYDPLHTLGLPGTAQECWQTTLDIAPGIQSMAQLASTAYPVGIASPLWYNRVWPFRSW